MVRIYRCRLCEDRFLTQIYADLNRIAADFILLKKKSAPIRLRAASICVKESLPLHLMHATLHHFRHWTFALAMCFGVGSLAINAAPIKTEHAEVELVAAENALIPGQSTRIALSIKHAPHWHTYWKNPGDSGYPTKVTWQLPPGYSVSAFDWPVPARLRTGPIVNFGYEGEVLLPASISIPRDAAIGTNVTIKGKAEWLVCKDVCIPEEGEVSLTLPIAATARVVNLDAWNKAEARVPKALDGWSGEARVHGRDMWIEIKPAANTPPLSKFDVFPEVEQVTEPAIQKVYASAAAPATYGAMLKLVDGAKVPDAFQLVISSPDSIGAERKFGFISISAKNTSKPEYIGSLNLLADAQSEVAASTSAVTTKNAATSAPPVNSGDAMSLA
jgi:DsbC/DsbD-like thiol-disulfide interchange protein